MKKFAILMVILMAFVLSGCGFEIVDTGHRGIETRFGEVIPGALVEGFYWYNPFTSNIIEMDVREQKWSSHTEASTKDVQSVTVAFVVNYHPIADQVDKLYQEVGTDWADKLLGQIVVGELKNAISHYAAVNLIEHRAEAVREAETGISNSVKSRRLEVTRFEIVDFQFTKEFGAAVEAKVTAAQNAERAKNDTVRISEEAQQRIIKAKAEAESIRIRTDALAKSPALIQYEAVQKWDGKLPQYMLGGNTTPFINLKN